MKSAFRIAAAAAVLAAFVAAPACAQKSKDTLRLPIEDPFSSFDSYLYPNDEVGDTHWYRPDFDLNLVREARNATRRARAFSALAGSGGGWSLADSCIISSAVWITLEFSS